MESNMFDQMGRQQINIERDIASRRMQALRSGMPSSQLAAMELQNIQTAQLGAQQVSQEYDQLRMQMQMELAGAEQMMAGQMMGDILRTGSEAEAIDAQSLLANLKGLVGEDVWNNLDAGQRLQLSQAFQGLDVLQGQNYTDSKSRHLITELRQLADNEPNTRQQNLDQGLTATGQKRLY